MTPISALRLPLLLLVGLLAACQSTPPPGDHYYRLLAAPVPSAATPSVAGIVAVAPFRAEGLYGERAILFSTERQPRRLEQYHYHLWISSPAQLLQEHARESLAATNLAAGVVTLDQGTRGDHVVSGKILAFERMTGNGNGKAVAELELQFAPDRHAHPLVRKIYRAEEPAADGSMEAFAAAMERALGHIYRDFLADIRAAGAK